MRALQTVWKRGQWDVRRVFAVALGSGYRIRFVVFRCIRRIARIGFRVEIGIGH
jgi:hypothetical protein